MRHSPQNEKAPFPAFLENTGHHTCYPDTHFSHFSHTAGKGSHVETCLLTAHGEMKPFSEGEMLDLLIPRSSNMSDAGGESKPRLSSKEQKQQMA